MGGLLRGSTLRVDRGRTGCLGEPGVQPGRAGDVACLLAGLGDRAADDLFDQCRFQPCPFEESRLCCAQELRGVQARQPAVALADGGSHGFDDDGIPHALLLVRTGIVKRL
jgi:hypothetical protein